MAIKRHTPEQIIFKLREIEVGFAQGKRIQDVADSGVPRATLLPVTSRFRQFEVEAKPSSWRCLSGRKPVEALGR